MLEKAARNAEGLAKKVRGIVENADAYSTYRVNCWQAATVLNWEVEREKLIPYYGGEGLDSHLGTWGGKGSAPETLLKTLLITHHPTIAFGKGLAPNPDTKRDSIKKRA